MFGGVVIWLMLIQVHMGLCTRRQIVPRLHVRYFHRCDHVVIRGMDQPDLRQVSLGEKLLCGS